MITKVIWRNAILIGLICALLEALLLLGTDPSIDRWVLAQSLFFWFGCGLVVYMAESGLPALPHSVLLTLLLSMPWYIVLAIAPGKLTLLPPLVIAGIVFGLLIGFLRKRLGHGPAIQQVR